MKWLILYFPISNSGLKLTWILKKKKNMEDLSSNFSKKNISQLNLQNLTFTIVSIKEFE